MHFYGTSYEATLKLPIKTFWLLSDNVDRIRAESDIRDMSVAISAQSGEGYEEKHKQLVLEIGTVIKHDAVAVILAAERDEEGFGELKRMAAAM